MKPLLALIDVQSAYLNARNLQPASGAVIARAAELLVACRRRDVPVVHIRTANSEGDRGKRLRDGAGLRPWTGRPEYAPPAELQELPDESVIHKSGHSAFRGDGADDLIEKLGADTILIAGLHLHACVRQSALDARERGLQVWITEDAVASDDPVHAAVTRRYLEDRSVRFVSVAQILLALDGHTAAIGSDARLQAVNHAVSGASSFAPTWRNSELAARVDLIRDLADRISHSAADLANIITQEVSKPIRFSTAEAQRSAEMLHAIVRHSESSHDSSGPEGTLVRRCPLGTVAVITPFNNPAYLPLGKIVPAVLFGNTVVWKPAPEASNVSRYLMELMSESAWPDRLVNLVEGGSRIGSILLNHPRVDAITITGSSSAGFSAQVAAAERRIPLQAELGGNNAAIVWYDADLATAAEAVAAGAFEMSGQRCTANRRVIVQEQILDSFFDLLTSATRDIACGSPLDERTRVSPLVTAERRHVVAGMISRAERDLGPSIFSYGDPSGLDSNEATRWCPPTILRCDDPSHEIVQEETFGPVLVVQTAKSWEDAIALCNGVRQGLAAAVFTDSDDVSRRFLSEARAGILKINHSTADASVDVPFGGWKMSGVGPPEHGIFDMEFFSRPQTIYNASERPL
jgi:alpha-ketoglutaric semialdehyde dehydrogenase